MRKCVRCNIAMVENCGIKVKGAAYGLVLTDDENKWWGGRMEQPKVAICPNCGEVFSVDENDYAQIVSQIKDKAFKEELDERIKIELINKKNEFELQKKDIEIDNDNIDKIVNIIENKIKENAKIEIDDEDVESLRNNIHVVIDQNHLTIKEMRNHYVEK